MALMAERHGLESRVPRAWSAELHSTAVSWMLLSRAAEEIAPVLDAGCARWTPIKGFDVGTRFHAVREERPLTDLDVLIAAAELDAVSDALAARGWRAGECHPRTLEFVAREGYTRHFSSPVAGGSATILVEVHFRLWGFVQEGLAAEILERASVDARVGGLRPEAEHTYVIAALHGWTKPSPRDLLDWRDLEFVLRSHPEAAQRIALASKVVDVSRRWALELPVCLSAEVAARLWPESGHERIVEGLEPSLRPMERRLLAGLREGGLDAVSLARIVLARLLAGRPSRAGWRSVSRRVWAHPGVVELETSPEHSWSRRRWTHVGRSLGRR
jgi:hypothetical protein